MNNNQIQTQWITSIHCFVIPRLGLLLFWRLKDAQVDSSLLPNRHLRIHLYTSQKFCQGSNVYSRRFLAHHKKDEMQLPQKKYNTKFIERYPERQGKH